MTVAAPPGTPVSTDRFVLVARCSLLVTLVNTHEDVAVLLVVAATTAVVFLQERLLRSPIPWFALATVVGTSQYLRWWDVDDHRVATTYWLLALAASRLARAPWPTLQRSARLLVGVMFALAFGWKLLSSQYGTGTFFEYTLLRDTRFEPAAVVAGGSDRDALGAGRADLTAFTADADFDDRISTPAGPRTGVVAAVLTVWGLLIEGAIALAFLAPLSGRSVVLRPLLVLAFCLTTYALVPVVGFGVLLVTMSLAADTTQRLVNAHIATLSVVFVWAVVLPLLR